MNAELKHQDSTDHLRFSAGEASGEYGPVLRGNDLVCRQRMRALTNWDPSYVGESVNWYEEYIARHGRLRRNWLQQPRDTFYKSRFLDICGLALYEGGHGHRVVAPLEDGSICLWDINQRFDAGKREKLGQMTQSRSGLLFEEALLTKDVGMSSEHLSVDDGRNTAYFAVGSRLVEVDLTMLRAIAVSSYPSRICALSPVQHPAPLTIGTALNLHLHDFREPPQFTLNRSDATGVDVVDVLSSSTSDGFPNRRLYMTPPTHAPLFQAGPLAILHASSSGRPSHSMSGTIIAAGRFPSLLIYDRRTFPKLQTTIYSGGRLCSLASVPMSFDAGIMEGRRQGSLAPSDITASKAEVGTTLISCGEYKGKGSLEIYKLPEEDDTPAASSVSAYKNRSSISGSKLLSVTTHGTRIVVSDGDGQLCWVERNGRTPVRRWNINETSQARHPSHRGLWSSPAVRSNHDDVARKLLSVKTHGTEREDLLYYTGERIALVGAGPPWEESLPHQRKNEEHEEDGENEEVSREEEAYVEYMRLVLERQADETRFMRDLGLG